MLRILLLFSLLFFVLFSFSQEEYNLKIILNNMEQVSLHSVSNSPSKKTTIYNDTTMFVNSSHNNLFYLKQGEKRYYLFITKNYNLEFSFSPNDTFLATGEYANFTYFINEYYESCHPKINQLLLY